MSGSNLKASDADDGTWFGTLKIRFQEVRNSQPDEDTLTTKTDKNIPTTKFLDACEETTKLFDLLGSKVFDFVKSDMMGNVTKLREREKAAPRDSATIQQLVETEMKGPKPHTATEGLTWLVRGLDFTAKALKADLSANEGIAATALKPKQELVKSFQASYNVAFKNAHSTPVRWGISAAMNATPYRKDFYAKLTGPGTNADTTKKALEKWVKALDEQVEILKAFLGPKWPVKEWMEQEKK